MKPVSTIVTITTTAAPEEGSAFPVDERMNPGEFVQNIQELMFR